MRTCYIFASALGEPTSFSPQREDLIIAADAGFMKLRKMGIVPHLTVGDFDSLKEIPENTEIIRHPVQKDDTDTLLAVKIGLEKGYKKFCLYGCAGKRLDHTLANLQTLSFIAENGAIGYLYGEDFIATAIKEASAEFPPKKAGTISVFSATSECEISIEGLLYPLKNAKVSYAFPIGVSNEFIGQKAKITVHKGTAIIIENKQHDCHSKRCRRISKRHQVDSSSLCSSE